MQQQNKLLFRQQGHLYPCNNLELDLTAFFFFQGCCLNVRIKMLLDSVNYC